MSIQVSIPVKVINFTDDQYEKWVNGEREDCIDPYCKGLPHSYGFGESIVGKYFEEQGYSWIHHDYNFLGGNIPGKYPLSEEVFINCMGKEKLDSARTIYKAFHNTEEPDLFIYKPDFSEIRFAESKRIAIKDKMRESQIRGLALFALLFGVTVEIYEIIEFGAFHDPKPVVCEF